MASQTPRRIAQIIRLRPEFKEEYIRVHAEVWPAVLEQIARSNIHDYSIFYDEDLGILFASFKYTGTDFDADMKLMAEDPKTREWWTLTDKMQQSFNPEAKSSETGGWWKGVPEVFHVE